MLIILTLSSKRFIHIDGFIRPNKDIQFIVLNDKWYIFACEKLKPVPVFA